MNPFDLYGPEFLLFFVCLAGALLGLVALGRRALEGYRENAGLRNVDPFDIAFLRGGAPETVKLAVMSLLDRGLLTEKEGELNSRAEDFQKVRRPIERAVLQKFRAGSRAGGVFFSGGIRDACRDIEDDLERRGLLVGARARFRRILLGIFAVGIASAVGIAKIDVAISRGRTNVQLLVILLVLFPWGVTLLLMGRRTARGDRFLHDVQVLLSGLRSRTESLALGAGTTELTLVLGAFGAGALWGDAQVRFARLFPAPVGASAAGGTAWSSSCGSVGGGCGGGSSCGGGGCGGGGCGGCGS